MLALSAVLAVPLVAQEKQGDKPVPAQEKPAPYKVGSVVDEKLTLVDLDGKPLSFKDLRGKVVLVHFWSVLCPSEPQAEIKFKAMAKRYEGKDVVFLAIASNQNEIGAEPAKDAKRSECYASVREHLKKEGIAYPVYLDHGNKVSDQFQAKSTPHCFVIDKKGAIVYAGALDDDPRGDKGDATKTYVRDAVDAALEGKEVTFKESRPYG